MSQSEARDAIDGRRWAEAFAVLAEADRRQPLSPERLEDLALTAYLTANDEVATDAWTRAHQSWLAAGDPGRAARCAFWLAAGKFFMGDMAPAMGWIARGSRVLEESDGDHAERALQLTLTNLPVLYGGDPDKAMPAFAEAVEISTRHADADVLLLARTCLGQAKVMDDPLSPDGMRLLDEVMVAVTSDDVLPLAAGIAYCAVIASCRDCFDVRRAREWTAALADWCDRQQDLVPFRGNCLVHRCEIMQIQGNWPDALDEAERACRWLAEPKPWRALGAAHFQLGEIRRLRGEFDAAEDAYRRAHETGRVPEPGMSLLRLARGHADDAAASIKRALAENADPQARPKLLPAAVDILLAAGDTAGAREAADELSGLAAMLGAPFVHALSAHATGSVLLAEGETAGALAHLRRAADAWRDLDAPHEGARTRVLMARACRQLGDAGGAQMELEAARATFEELGAEPDLAALAAETGAGAGSTPGGLTAREVEVLRHVASGLTNRSVAAELVISEKTVARHVSNIFAKLGVSSRAAATAYAYEHGLV